MATIRFTEADRDDQGFVTVPAPRSPEPRSLADLLPTPSAIQSDARRNQKRPPTKAETASMIALGLLLLALMAYLWSSGDAAPASAPPVPASIPARAQQSGDSVTLPSPIPAVVPAAVGRLLIAFAAPDGEILGAIESTRPVTPTAHYGDDWIQADVQGSGLVWLRAADSPELQITGPDLSPRRAAPIPASAPPRAPAAPAATPPPPPPPCAEAGVPGKMVQVCDYVSLSDLESRAKQQWMEQYGGSIGTVTTPSPQAWETTP